MNKIKNDYVIFSGEYEIPIFTDNLKRFTPQEADIINCIGLLNNYLNKKKELQSLENYKIQFCGYYNKEGQKIIWANYFCDDFDIDWKKEVVFVFDGGNCFFNVKINIDTDEIFDFNVNGES